MQTLFTQRLQRLAEAVREQNIEAQKIASEQQNEISSDIEADTVAEEIYRHDYIQYSDIESLANEEKDSLDKDSYEARLRAEDYKEKQLKNSDLRQNIAARAIAGGLIFLLVTAWLVFVGFIIWQACFSWDFLLSDSVLNSLLIGATAQVIALLAIVLHYLFPNNKKAGG